MAGYTQRMENRGLSSFVLRIIAMIAMTWGAAQLVIGDTGVDWYTYMLWFSFSIFSFLLAEGLQKSTDRVLYLRRLLVFTVISEFAGDLLFYGSLFDIRGQSVMITLLFGYLVILAADTVKKRFDNMILTLLTLIVLGFAATFICVKCNAIMGDYGILFICMYYVCLNLTYTRIMELVCFGIFLLNVPADNYFNIMINNMYYSFPDKSFAFLGVILTWFYNGKRGPNNTKLNIFFYSYLPLMTFIMFIIKAAV